MCHGAAVNFAGEAALRTLLGVFEASINPGTMLLFSMYYERDEQPLRMGIWIGSAGLGYVIAGISSFGIGHITATVASWRLLYIIWGSITTAWGIILVIFLPGSPLETKFLNDDERSLVVNRIKGNGTGLENKNFKWTQFMEAMMDLKTWLLFLFAVTSNSPNGGLTSVGEAILHKKKKRRLLTRYVVSRVDHQRHGVFDSQNNSSPNAIRGCSILHLPFCLVGVACSKR